MSELHISRAELFKHRGREIFSSLIPIESLPQSCIDDINDAICKILTNQEVLANESIERQRASGAPDDASQASEV